MKTTVRGICWLVVLSVIPVLSASTLWAADENWVSRPALGDLLVTRSGAVAVYGNDGTLKHTVTVTGDNREIAFDIDLNAYVANFVAVPTPSGRIVKLPAATPHTPAFITVTSARVDSTYNSVTPAPRSVAIDRLQNLWVGLDNAKPLSGGFVGVIQRYAKDTATGPYLLKQEFSVQSDGGPISLDVYVKEDGTPVVYYTSRGSNVWVLDTTKPEVPQNPSEQNSAVFRTLTGQGEAAQLRILAPGKAEGAETGGFLVAFKKTFKLVTSAGVQRTCDFTDSVATGQKQRTHVELDANPLFWWAADAGTGDWRKLDFRTGCSAAPSPGQQIATNLPSGGGAVNGGLRVGPHLSFMTFPANTNNVSKTAGFLPKPAGGFTHSVIAMVDNQTNNVIRAAAWFVEVLSDGVCSPQPNTSDLGNPYALSDFDCRSVTNFGRPPLTNNNLPYAIQGTSRTREHYTWIHEITSPPLPTSGVAINVSVFYSGNLLPTEPSCPSSEVRATWLLDDVHPDLHQAAGGTNAVVLNQFDNNNLGAFFQDPTSTTPPKGSFNHYAVARGCVAFRGAFDPVGNQPQALGSTLTLTFTIVDGANVFQGGLDNFLNLTVAYKANGQPLADRFGFWGPFLGGTGILPVTGQQQRYKINVNLDPTIFVLQPPETNTIFEFCVNAVGQTTAVREFCLPVTVKPAGNP
jgi:hypothetical protein